MPEPWSTPELLRLTDAGDSQFKILPSVIEQAPTPGFPISRGAS